MNTVHGERVPIAQVADVIQGQSPPGSSYNTEGRGLPFLQGKAEFGDMSPTPVKWCSDPRKIAERDDVLLSIRAPVGPTNLCAERSAIGRGLAALRPKPGVSPRYLMYAVRATEPALRRKSTGTTFDAVSGSTVRTHEVWIAPPDEREEAVRAFEAASSTIDAGEESLRRARKRLRAYRDAVLEEAWTGFGCPETSAGALPRGWSSRSLRELAASADYGTSEKCDYTFAGPPVVRIPNVIAGRLDLADLKFARTTGARRPAPLAPGDLLVVRTNGSRDLIGRAALVTEELERAYYHASYLIRFHIAPIALARWVALLWHAPRMRRAVIGAAATSAGQYNVSLARLYGLTMPTPPEDELASRTAQVAAALDAAETMDTAARVQMERAPRLRLRVLTRFFGGESAS